MIVAVFALLGLIAGGAINVLADDLPARIRPRRPHCPQCGHVYGPAGWLAIGRKIQGGACPQCGLVTRRRALLVELGTAMLYAVLPLLITPPLDLVIYSFYIAVLILIIVIDVEHRLVLHVVTLPTMVIALFASYPLEDNTIRLAVVGGAVGFILFFLAYLLGQRLFGPGALGFGDVTLATTMGLMLGFHRIFFALILGILLAGLWSLVGLLTGRISRRSYFAYGPFLAVAGIVMIIWGDRLYAWAAGA
ncbi:MAG: prepilin peptidase [Chloroflexota bacterium]|nr:MAG: prepilin peptidase [Chloroflexota bacterium]